MLGAAKLFCEYPTKRRKLQVHQSNIIELIPRLPIHQGSHPHFLPRLPLSKTTIAMAESMEGVVAEGEQPKAEDVEQKTITGKSVAACHLSVWLALYVHVRTAHSGNLTAGGCVTTLLSP